MVVRIFSPLGRYGRFESAGSVFSPSRFQTLTKSALGAQAVIRDESTERLCHTGEYAQKPAYNPDA